MAIIILIVEIPLIVMDIKFIGKRGITNYLILSETINQDSGKLNGVENDGDKKCLGSSR